MKICDRCHASKNIDGPYTTGVHLSDEPIEYPAVQIINLDLCRQCVVELREVIRTFLKPIGFIQVKHYDHKEPSPARPGDNFDQSVFDDIPKDLV